MDPQQQLTAYQQILNKARRAGLLRYEAHGIAILVQPAGAATPAAPATPAPASPAPAAPPAPGD